MRAPQDRSLAKAVTLWCQGRLSDLCLRPRIRAVSISFKLPSVIRLLRYIKIEASIRLRAVLTRQHLRARRPSMPVLRRAVSNQRVDVRPTWCRSPGAAAGLGEHRHLLRAVTAGQEDARRPKPACIYPDSQTARLDAGRSHHGGTAPGSRKLAGLSVLERRTRRHVASAFSRDRRFHPNVHSPDHIHHAGANHSRRTHRFSALASPWRQACRPCVSATTRRASSSRRPRNSASSSRRWQPARGTGWRRADHRSCGGGRVDCHRSAPGGQPGVRCRRQPCISPTAAHVASRCPCRSFASRRAAAARVSRRASPIPRAWRFAGRRTVRLEPIRRCGLKLSEDGRAEVYASDLGIIAWALPVRPTAPCSLATARARCSRCRATATQKRWRPYPRVSRRSTWRLVLMVCLSRRRPFSPRCGVSGVFHRRGSPW